MKVTYTLLFCFSIVFHSTAQQKFEMFEDYNKNLRQHKTNPDYSYPYKSYSGNRKYYYKSYALNTGMVYRTSFNINEIGITQVYEAENDSLLYTFDKYFPVKCSFISNSGTIFQLKPYGYVQKEEPLVWIYKNGILDTTFNGFQILNEEPKGWDVNQRWVLKNKDSVVDKDSIYYDSIWINNAYYVINETAYVLSNNQEMIVIDLQSAEISDRIPAKAFFEEANAIPYDSSLVEFMSFDKQAMEMHMPMFYDNMPSFTKSSFQDSLAAYLDLIPLDPDSIRTLDIDYQTHGALFFCEIDIDGNIQNLQFYHPDSSEFNNEVRQFADNVKFDGVVHPYKLPKWFYNFYGTYRNKSLKMAQEEYKREKQAIAAATHLDGTYIPKDLNDCINELNKTINEEEKNEIKGLTEKEFNVKSHMRFGLGLRNNWGLWADSRLAKYFNDLEIFHPDDMSGIILTSYYRSLTGKDIELNKQIKYYKAYWRKAKKKEKARLKEYGKRLDRYKIGDQVKVLFRLDTSKTTPRGYLIARHGSKNVNETVEIVGVIEDKEKDAEEYIFNLKIKIVEIKGYDEIQFGNNHFIKKHDVINYSILNLPPEKLRQSFLP